MSSSHDVVVVGAGSGGLAAAHTAQLRGASVCIVQEGPIGGDCTWTGCVPSKALLAAAESGQSFDTAMQSVRDAVLEVAGAESAEVLRRQGIVVVEGHGRLLGAGRVEVGADVVTGRHVIVSPGSRPAVPPIPGIADVPYLTNEDIFDLREQPQSLIIIGGGPIGCEMAQAFAALGTTVTVVEGADRILPRDDPAAAAIAHSRLAAQGVDVRTGRLVAKVGVEQVGVEEVGGNIAVTLAGGDVIAGEKVLVATGRAPSHDGMGLAEIGVKSTEAGWISVDATLRTAADGVWAVGDAVGSTQFTHAAAHMARLAVDNALGIGIARVRKLRFDPREIPWVTFMSPEIAQVGVTEEQARSIDGARVAHLPLTEVDRAVAVHKTDGFITLIARPRRVLGDAGGGRLIGATIVAPTAGELIGEAALAIRTGLFAGRLAQTVHAYPTWSFGLQTAAAQFVGTINGRTARPPR